MVKRYDTTKSMEESKNGDWVDYLLYERLEDAVADAIVMLRRGDIEDALERLENADNQYYC